MTNFEVYGCGTNGRNISKTPDHVTNNPFELHVKLNKLTKDGQANCERVAGAMLRIHGTSDKQEAKSFLRTYFPGVIFVIVPSPVCATYVDVLFPTAIDTRVEDCETMKKRLNAAYPHLDADAELFVGDLTVDEFVCCLPWAPDDTKSDEYPLGPAFYHRLPDDEVASGESNNRTLYSYGCSLVRDEDACSEENRAKTSEFFGNKCLECDVDLYDVNLLWENIISFRDNVLYPWDGR